MARKSRKGNNQEQAPTRESHLIQTAAYVRLSVEDRSQKGNSIETQKQIISSFMDENPQFALFDTYVDSGVSGTTFEREGFRRMLLDAEAGKISCVISKDLSRLGRNVIDTGYYTEQVFPKLGLRLISINDNYDSSTYDGGVSLPLINLLNETYALDISRKRRSQAHHAMKDGEYVGGQPPFGYIRSPDNHRKLLVDMSAATIVQQIFSWASAGENSNEIARRLNNAKIHSPANHHKLLKTPQCESVVSHGRWYARTVDAILENEIYLGHLIQGKTKAVFFSREQTNPDEWIHAYNAHEAIISPELFQSVRLIRQKKYETAKGKPEKHYSPNLYKGKIRCAHCGGHMERKKSLDRYIFRCVSNRTAPNSCDGNHIGEESVHNALMQQLVRLKGEVSELLDAPSRTTELIPELQFIEMELLNSERFTRSLYESLVNGTLTNDEYMVRKREHQAKMDEFKERAAVLQQLSNDEKATKKNLQKSLKILESFVTAPTVTSEYIDRFVCKVVVFKEGRIHFDLKL